MASTNDHLRLLAGSNSGGAPVYEVVPARPGADDLWEILGTPALAEGLAAGDVVRVAPGGRYEVVERGGNVGVVSYARPGEDVLAAADSLRKLSDGLGTVEADPAGRWVVTTLPVTLGFTRIEDLFNEWSAATGAGWSFVNVYDENDQPLNWWR